MNFWQAQLLLDTIQMWIRRAEPRQLGNGEWVIILKRGHVFIWNACDWRHWQQEHSDLARESRTA